MSAVPDEDTKMSAEEMTSFFKALPKSTPVWAVGIVSIIVSVAISFAIVYTLGRTEVRQYLEGQADLNHKAIEIEGKAVSSIIQLVTNNSNQVTELSIALNQTQRQNSQLTERVSQLEKDFAVSRARVELCESNLEKCTSGDSNG
jgi:hypothetical protein